MTEKMTLDDFPLAAVEHAIIIPAVYCHAAVFALTSCGHGHTFIVDQSRAFAPEGHVTIGVSPSGKTCLEAALKMLSPGGGLSSAPPWID